MDEPLSAGYACYTGDFSCFAYCDCDDGRYGDSCSMGDAGE